MQVRGKGVFSRIGVEELFDVKVTQDQDQDWDQGQGQDEKQDREQDQDQGQKQKEKQDREQDQEHSVNKASLFQIVCVSPEARGLGLATDLVRRSIGLAQVEAGAGRQSSQGRDDKQKQEEKQVYYCPQCLGFKGAKTEATGAYSRQTLNTHGRH